MYAFLWSQCQSSAESLSDLSAEKPREEFTGPLKFHVDLIFVEIILEFSCPVFCYSFFLCSRPGQRWPFEIAPIFLHVVFVKYVSCVAGAIFLQ